ncbi:MAG: ATP-binding protein [Pseudomonadota bacterium]
MNHSDRSDHTNDGEQASLPALQNHRGVEDFLQAFNQALICVRFRRPLNSYTSNAMLRASYRSSRLHFINDAAARLFGVTQAQREQEPTCAELQNPIIDTLISHAFPVGEAELTQDLKNSPRLTVDLTPEYDLLLQVEPTFVFEGDGARDVWLRVTDRTQEERLLREQRQLQHERELAMNAASLFHFQFDREADSVFIDPRGLVGTGLSSMPDKLSEVLALLGQEQQEYNELKLQEFLAGESMLISFVARIRNPASTLVYLEFWGMSNAEGDGRGFGMFRDVTRPRLLQAQLQEKETLERLGLLAGGIAHDFNNVLMSILGHAELLDIDLSSQPLDTQTRRESSRAIGEIREATRRASDLCTSLLTYAGRHPLQRTVVSLADAVSTTLNLLRVTVDKRVQIDLTGYSDACIAADRGQLTQVIFNLVGNAAEAIATRNINSGRIDLAVEAIGDVSIAERHEIARQAWFNWDTPRFVRLTIRDNGVGMDQATRARMFDPFFTTKPQGRGLGMAAVKTIVQNHEGAIIVDSAPGAGTEFRLYFPQHLGVETDTEQPASASSATGRRAATRVLLVDDQPEVREVAAQLLRQLDCEVTEAATATEALASANDEQFDCALIDVTMPDMPGTSLAQELLRFDNQTQIVLMSGYTEFEIPDALRDSCRFIHKPYTIDELSAAIRL